MGWLTINLAPNGNETFPNATESLQQVVFINAECKSCLSKIAQLHEYIDVNSSTNTRGMRKI